MKINKEQKNSALNYLIKEGKYKDWLLYNVLLKDIDYCYYIVENQPKRELAKKLQEILYSTEYLSLINKN